MTASSDFKVSNSVLSNTKAKRGSLRVRARETRDLAFRSVDMAGRSGPMDPHLKATGSMGSTLESECLELLKMSFMRDSGTRISRQGFVFSAASITFHQVTASRFGLTVATTLETLWMG